MPKLTPDEKTALEKLRGNSAPIAAALEGSDFSKESLTPNLATSVDYLTRLDILSTELRGYLVQMGNELDELGDSEFERLKDEATGIVLALREIHRCFPELNGAQDDQ